MSDGPSQPPWERSGASPPDSRRPPQAPPSWPGPGPGQPPTEPPAPRPLPPWARPHDGPEPPLPVVQGVAPTATNGPLRDADPVDVAAAAALLAAALVVLAALSVLLLATSDDFPSTAGDRVRLAGDVLRLPAPVLLLAGLLLRTRAAATLAADGRTALPGGRLWDVGAVVVAGVAGVLLVARLLVDLLGRVTAAGGPGGAGVRAGAVLQDLAALLVVAATGHWALRRAAQAGAGADRSGAAGR